MNLDLFTPRRLRLASLPAGVLAAFCFPHAGWTGFVFDPTPWSFPIFSACLAVLFFSLRSCFSFRSAFWSSFLFSFGFFTASLSWVGNALLIEGNPYAWAYPLALFGLPLILTPFWIIPLTFSVRWIRGLPLSSSLLVFVGTLSLAEFARGHLFTGFPWNLPAMLWIEMPPLAQGFALVGPYGLTLLTLLWAAGLLALFRPGARRVSILAAVSFLIVAGYGTRLFVTVVPSPPSLFVRLVQANIPQSEKWDTDRLMDHFHAHLALMESAPAPNQSLPVLTLWPETALSPGYVYSPVVAAQVQKTLTHDPVGSALVTGALIAQESGRDITYANSILAYSAAGINPARYDKHHLVPFGEYIPYQDYIPLGPVTQFTGLQAGPGPRVMQVDGLPPFIPLVCYEAIFPEALRVPTGGFSPQFIVNVTNDSWYGDSPGPSQHLDQARARAIEQGLPLIRSAGTGISAVVNPFGSVVSSLPYGHAGALTISLPSPLPGLTPYRRMGEVIFLFLILVNCGFILLFRQRR